MVSKCHKILKQISIGSPICATNYFAFCRHAANLKRLGNSDIQYNSEIYAFERILMSTHRHSQLDEGINVNANTITKNI